MHSYNLDDSLSYNCSQQTQSYRKHHNQDSSFFNKQPNTHEQYEPIPQSISIPPQPSEYQFLIYENKIQILNDRLQCYMEEVENLKKTNSILFSKLSSIQQLDQDLENQKNKNYELRQQIQNYRDQIQNDKISYQTQIEELKNQLEQKEQFVNLLRQEHEKISNKKDQQINYLKETLKQKLNRLQTYEKKLHTLEIQRLNTEDDFATERDSYIMKNSQISRIKTLNSENVNSMNLQKSTVSVEQKAKMFMKRDPSELKIMFKSLTHAQKCLEIGGQELSMIGFEREQQKSMMNASRLTTTSKINKTYCK